jgi:guanylate kinase
MRHHLIALVGPPGVGKTYFTDYLVRTHPETFAITRSVTTRAPRNADDHEHYEFLNDAQFAEGVASGHILATARVRDKQYGLDLAYIREMLKTRNGVIALVAETVELLRTIPDLAPLLRVIFLKPASRAVLEHNLAMREPDPTQRAANLALAETWAFPERPDATLIVRGEKEQLPELATLLQKTLSQKPLYMDNRTEKRILLATTALLVVIATALALRYVLITSKQPKNNQKQIPAVLETKEQQPELARIAALLPGAVEIQTVHRLSKNNFWVAVAQEGAGETYLVSTIDNLAVKISDTDFPTFIRHDLTINLDSLAGSSILAFTRTTNAETHAQSTDYIRLEDAAYVATVSWWGGEKISFHNSINHPFNAITLEKSCVPVEEKRQSCTITGLNVGGMVAAFKEPHMLDCEIMQKNGACRFPTGLGKPIVSMGHILTFSLPWNHSVRLDIDDVLQSITSESFATTYPFRQEISQ